MGLKNSLRLYVLPGPRRNRAYRKTPVPIKIVSWVEYLEGIELLEEVNDVLHRTLGPSHELTKFADVQFDKAKDAYRRYLLKLVGAENK